MEEAVWGIAGIVVGVGATIGVEWWVDRRHRSRDFRAARMRTRDYMTEGIRGCGLYATLGAWSGPPARPDPVDLGLIREHADQDQWRRIDHGVGAVVAATMTANSPLILDDHELRSGVIEGLRRGHRDRRARARQPGHVAASPAGTLTTHQRWRGGPTRTRWPLPDYEEDDDRPL